MLYSTSKLIFAGALLLTLATLTGCMSDTPAETDLPWSTPSSWEGTIPLPSSMTDRYQ